MKVVREHGLKKIQGAQKPKNTKISGNIEIVTREKFKPKNNLWRGNYRRQPGAGAEARILVFRVGGPEYVFDPQ